MKITKKQLRYIIREELIKESSVQSILVPGVSHDLFVESFCKFERPWSNIENRAYKLDPEATINRLMSHSLSREISSDIVHIVDRCWHDQCDMPKFPPERWRWIDDLIHKALNEPLTPTENYKESLDVKVASYFASLSSSHIFFTNAVVLLGEGAFNVPKDESQMYNREEASIKPGVYSMGAATPELLEERIRFMDAMRSFTVRKQVDPEYVQKIMDLCYNDEGIDGMIHAAFLYDVM